MMHGDKNEGFTTELIPGGRTKKELSYGGYLQLEHDIPFLFIYRNVPHDSETIRLARIASSYLIVGDNHFDYFHKIIQDITKKMSKRFGSFIIIELYTGPLDSHEFVIRGPAHKLSVSLRVLQDELNKVEPRTHGGQKISARTKHTKHRVNPNHKEFFSIEKIKERGGTFIGLEIPPVFRKKNGAVYPIYFKTFRKRFTEAVHKSVLEFIRIQTTSKLKSYAALGQRTIQEELFNIDKKLTEIENAYQFLLLIAPVNIQSLRKRFFESNFNTINPYHYRLLPVDPDLLKKNLYNLRIDKIDDPALSFLYEEKREEIDKELSMLKERDSKNFFYSSLRRYKGIGKNVRHEARLILENIPEDTEMLHTSGIDAHNFGALAKTEIHYLQKQTPDFKSQVHIRNDVNVIMVSRGDLYLPADYTTNKKEASGIIQHEIGTHAVTYYNGSQQPLTQLSQGLAGYDSLQEGLAVLSEYLVGSLTGNRLRLLAGRVVAGEALLDDAEFKEVFNLLYSNYGFSKEPAFNITSRVFQGGGFLKDIVYLRGLVQVCDYLKNGGDLEYLLLGKFSLEHLPLIKDLTDREIVQPPKIKPRYFETDGFKERMSKLKHGISLSNLAS